VHAIATINTCFEVSARSLGAVHYGMVSNVKSDVVQGVGLHRHFIAESCRSDPILVGSPRCVLPRLQLNTGKCTWSNVSYAPTFYGGSIMI
jgi:hypothetical protein